MSLVSTLLQESSMSGYDTSDIEAGLVVYESEDFFNNACADLAIGICQINEAYDVADIMASVKVVTEGANPEALMENMVTSALGKLKELWIKMLAKIKSFFAKVIDFFKSLVLSNKKFVKEFGKRLKDKAKGLKDPFKYKGYKYTISAGDAAVDKVSKAVTSKFMSYLGNMDMTDAANANASDLEGKVGSAGKKDPSEVQNEVVKGASVGANDQSELKANIIKTYHDGEEDKGEQELSSASQVNDMIKHIEGSADAISKFKKEQGKYEDMCNKIIKKLDAMGKKDGNSKEAKMYTNASKISAICSALISTYRIATNAQIEAYKGATRQYSAVLRKFLRSGFMAESVMFETDDVDDIDLDGDDVVEAAVDDADDSVGDSDDIGISGVEEGKDCDKKCKKDDDDDDDDDDKDDDDDDILEAALRYL